MKKRRTFLLFLIPSLILFTFTAVYPFVSGIHLAFTDWDGISKTYNYIGFANFASMFTDKNIWDSIKITLGFALSFTILNNVMALILGIFLNNKFMGQGIIKTIFFVPMALSPVLAAFVWGFIDRSILSGTVLSSSLLGNPGTVIIGIIIIALWNGIGSNIMIYMAGLANIPDDYYEAAAIDGASGLKRFWFITLPLLGPSFTMCITLTLTSALREFATTMSATGGGPAKSSEMLSLLIYRNLFSYQKAGYGQAISIAFMIILVVIGMSLTRFFRSREVEM